MKGVKEIWVCNDCGNTQKKWTGSCSLCQNWNTFEKELLTESSKFQARPTEGTKPVRINEVNISEFHRDSTGFTEFDRLLGGGLVVGSLSLVGGDPGIGKSTMMLQLAYHFSLKGKKVLYVCGEESAEQTSLRARRLGIESDHLYLYSETIFANIKTQIENLKPDLLIMDSVQIIYKNELPSLPGSVTQVKELAMECMHIAKGMGITTFLIGHVTKSGELAGPRVLEHIVDTVLDFEGDRQHGYRMLRSSKNRFGPTDEVSIFQMGTKGLTEVLNPSEIFLEERIKEVTGSAISSMMEGSRALLIEIQALVAASAFSTSSRRSTGLDQNRLALLLAVLEKRMGYHFHSLDVFVSVAGGIRITEPASDLGVLMAITSSFCNRPIDADTVIIGEVGLAGEVRSVPRIENRIKEAKHLGFTKCIIPKKNLSGLTEGKEGIEVIGVELVEEVVSILLD